MDFRNESSSSSSRELFDRSSASNASTMTHKRKVGRKKTKHPIYRGVRHRNGMKWVCEVRVPNEKSRIWLGTYVTSEMAARAYDVAALALRGESTPLNFPDSAWLLPRAKSTLASDIRSAAFEAAEAFRPTDTSSSSSSSTSAQTALKLPHAKSPDKFPETTSSRMFSDEEAAGYSPTFEGEDEGSKSKLKKSS